jgi:hypothetical protein
VAIVVRVVAVLLEGQLPVVGLEILCRGLSWISSGVGVGEERRAVL